LRLFATAWGTSRERLGVYYHGWVPDVWIDSREQIAAECARRFERAAARAIDSRGRFTCAVPGGSAAQTCCPALARADVDWSRTQVFWADERAVAPSDPQSNYRLAWQLWLQHVEIPAAGIHRMRADAADLSRAAMAYDTDLRHALGDPPALDLLLLGVGPDGHVCSLFPGHRALDERTRYAVAVGDAPKPPPRRITLTLPAIRAARTILVCAIGEEKAEAVRDGLSHQNAASPLALATRDHADVAWLLDPAAAASVTPPSPGPASRRPVP
jgi:6-phosphogluconolactonase